MLLVTSVLDIYFPMCLLPCFYFYHRDFFENVMTKHPSIDRQIKKLWYIHMMECSSAIKIM